MVKTGSVLLKKTRRDIVKNWRQFITIILIAALAVCLFTGFIANYQVFKNRVDTLYKDGNMASVFVYTTRFDEADLTRVQQTAGVKLAEHRSVLGGFVGGVSASVMSVGQNSQISKYATLDGEFVDNGVLVEKSFAKSKNIEINQTITFNLPVSNYIEREFFDVELVVTGIMTHPECVGSGNYSTTYIYTSSNYFNAQLNLAIADLGAMAPAVSSAMAGLIAPNQIVLTLQDGAQEDEVVSLIQTEFSQKENNNLVACLKIDGISTNSGVSSDIVQAKQMTFVFPVIFFLVAMLVILTTISQIILREKTQIGTMKAVGLKNSTIMLHYITLTITLISIGFVMGMIVGPLLIPNVMNIKYNVLFILPKLTYIFPVFEILATYVIFNVAGTLLCFGICKNEIIKYPADSMRSSGPPISKMSVVEKLKVSKKFKMPTKMALRNIAVKRSRSVMVVVGIMGCMALLLCGYGIEDTLNHGIDNDLNHLYFSNINVTYATASQHTELSGIGGIKYYENYTSFPVTIFNQKSYQSTIRVIDDNSRIFGVQYDKTKIAISNKVASELSLKVGDSASFNVLGTSYDSTIGAVFDAFFYHGIVVPSSIYVDLAEMSNGAFVLTQDGVDVEELNATLQNLNAVSSSLTYNDFKEKVSDILSSIKIMTSTLKIFAISLAVVVLCNIALLNFKERHRDIATLKVLGFNKGEIARSLILEIMILTLLGAFFGAFFGLPMVELVLSINETPVVSFLYSIRLISFVLSFVITICTSLAINFILTNFTDRIKMVESLKSYE